MENLTFGTSNEAITAEEGASDGNPDTHPDRIVAICNKLGVRQEVIQYIMDGVVRNWREVLSLTESVLLHLARALVANPEGLVIHKPTLVFDDAAAETVFRALRAFVDERGLEQDPSQRLHRRPRTCFCTVSRPTGVQIADQVLQCSKMGTYE